MLDTAIARQLPDGSFAGCIGIAVDITDFKQHQENLMAAQKLESLGVLVSGLAHNFNNLMGSIIAEADLALSELPTGSPVHGNVERINSVAIRAADIVFLLTVYASAEPAGPLMPVNVSGVVEDILPLIKATVSRNIAFRMNLERKVPPIRADMSHIRQVVMNLLTNACESLPNQEGSVCVNTSAVHIGSADTAKDQLRLPPGNYVRLCVTDSGCGIATEVRAKIFDPFYTTKFLGRGLGLAAVQGIVRSLGGAIHIQSTLGRGSTFEVLFPGINGDTS
jgi:C4-dicarboxylate-specific signal transduction histidine kinase